MGLILVSDDEASSRQRPKEAKMGLTDILTGMMNGPRGQRQPSSGGGGGGLPPIKGALLGLLPHKAPNSRGGQAAYPRGTGHATPPRLTRRAGHPGGRPGPDVSGVVGGQAGE